MFKRLDLVNWKMTLEVKDSNSPQVWMMVFRLSGFNLYVPNPLGSFSTYNFKIIGLRKVESNLV